ANVPQTGLAKGNTYTFSNKKDTVGIKMTINSINGLFYYRITIRKYYCSPVNIKFHEKTPDILPLRYWMTQANIDAYSATMKIDINRLPIWSDPSKLVVYQRDTVGSGYFSQIPTTFNQSTNELIITATKFGELIIGMPYEEESPGKPILIKPSNREKVNSSLPIRCNWSPTGFYTHSQLQIAADSDFTDIKVDEPKLELTELPVPNLEKDKKYFWRVRLFDGDSIGLWSDIYTFSVVEPFIKIISPNGGEQFKHDSTLQIIRWDKNISDSVRLDLYRNDVFYMNIIDSFYRPNGAFKWKIPENAAIDSTYKIKITSINEPSLTSISDSYFSILDSITGIADEEPVSGLDLILKQCYPNPSNGLTIIEFEMKNESLIKIGIYDNKGILLESIINEILPKQNYRILWNATNLPSGVYYIRMITGNSELINKLILIK
ncbi:MAG: hypothetical protein QG635_1737, partial [Bacteroidota bacterium]|nr:hypothetical protein [Bacteroidota bacterium]